MSLLDELNATVTGAILRAESLPSDSWEAQAAFRFVADLEEEIATVVGAHTVEGEIARLGAISAALSAGEPLRALQFAERYRTDALAPAVRAKLDQLVRDAEDDVQRILGETPQVEPRRFTLRAA